MGRAPTIKDVARHAGVSVATVSNVLNERESVNRDIVRRVREAVDALDYRRHQFGWQLKTKKSSLVNVIDRLDGALVAARVDHIGALDDVHAATSTSHVQPSSILVTMCWGTRSRLFPSSTRAAIAVEAFSSRQSAQNAMAQPHGLRAT